MDKVQQMISDVERKIGKINKIIGKGANKLTVKDVLKVAQKGNSINSTIKKGIKTYGNVTPTDKEAEAIYQQMVVIVDEEEKLLAFAIENKPTFDKLKVAGIIKMNLKRSEENALLLSDVMVEKTPLFLKPQAEALAKRAKKSFHDCMGLYSNATGGEDQFDESKVDDSD